MSAKFLSLTLLTAAALTTALAAPGFAQTNKSAQPAQAATAATAQSALTQATTAQAATAQASTTPAPNKTPTTHPLTPTPETQLVVKVDHLPASFDPLKADAFGRDFTALSLVTATLFSYDEGGTGLKAVKAYKISKDFRTYEFDLRELFWSDSKRVSAEDYVYAFHRLLKTKAGREALAGLNLENFAQVAAGALPADKLGVKAESAFKLVFHLSQPNATIFNELANVVFAPQRADNDFSPEKYLASGEYHVTKQEDGSLSFSKNPYYFSHLAYDKLTLTTKDVPHQLSFANRENLSRWRQFLAFNPAKLSLAQRLVLNRTLTNQLFANNLVPETAPNHLHPLNDVTDVVAKRLLKKEGFSPEHKFAVKVLAWDGDKDSVEQALQLYRNADNQLGNLLEVSADYVDYRTYLKRLEAKEFEVVYANKFSPTNYFAYAGFRCGASDNFTSYCNPQLDKLLDVARDNNFRGASDLELTGLTKDQAGTAVTSSSASATSSTTNFFDFQNLQDRVEYVYKLNSLSDSEYNNYVQAFYLLQADPVWVELGRKGVVGTLTRGAQKTSVSAYSFWETKVQR